MGKSGKQTAVKRLILLLLVLLGWAPDPRLHPRDPGMRVEGPWRPVRSDELHLFTDVTMQNRESHERIVEQEIFDEMLRRIHRAEKWIVLDFFLWNDWGGGLGAPPRSLARELSAALIARKKARPEMTILVLTDPFNRLYGGHESGPIADLRAAGIPVLYTDLFRLPESNLALGRPLARLSPLLRRLPGLDHAWLPNPVDPGGGKLTLREYGRLLHFKANHRKVLIADDGGRPGVLVTSFNPAGGSWAHDNLAITASGAVALDALRSELSLMEAALAGPYADTLADPSVVRGELDRMRLLLDPSGPDNAAPDPTGPRVRWLTEGAIRDAVLDQLAPCGEGDDVTVMMFYLSDRAVVRALIRAAEQGARVRVILDANRDAFGREKNGIPNRAVAVELMAAGRKNGGRMTIRWAMTSGEQYHLKAMAIRNMTNGRFVLLGGSANWTRRNLQDLNLEADLLADRAPEIVAEAFEYFEGLWTNRNGAHTRSYEDYAETGWARIWKTGIYRIQEPLGACTY